MHRLMYTTCINLSPSVTGIWCLSPD